jgi:hypothetical protein
MLGLETAYEKERHDNLTNALERCERRITDETASLRLDIVAVREEVTAQGGRLRQELNDHQFELLKWAFAFWVGQTLATLTLIGVVLAR